jgi:ACR3 family arsenite efflux pump ArsB
MDKLLTPFVFCAMVIGVILGEFAPSVREALDAAKFDSVSLRKLFSFLLVLLLITLYSDCYWTYCHDVACSHKNSI